MDSPGPLGLLVSLSNYYRPGSISFLHQGYRSYQFLLEILPIKEYHKPKVGIEAGKIKKSLVPVKRHSFDPEDQR